MSASFRWALIDIETTGLHITHDKITEIAVIILTEKGVEATWHSLINPECSIPEQIIKLTGIDNNLVQNAPTFTLIAEELILLLQGCILVAHNARFDYSFLKNAFKECNITFQIPVLCSIKLLKNFYPAFKSYKLSAIAQAFCFAKEVIHRAQDDVNLLRKVIEHLFQEFSLIEVLRKAKKIYQQSSIPSTLVTDCSTFPDTPGVYIFYGNEKTLPLYIGKSISLRQRILSHFQADHAHAKEFVLSQQVKYIEVIPTAGELSALLLESALIKERMPLYNRRLRKKKSLVTIKATEMDGYITLTALRTTIDDEFERVPNNLFGAFRSINAAKKIMLYWVKEFGLCAKLCNLELTKHACFSYQLKKCQGACIKAEPSEVYNHRVKEALGQYKRETWPYKGSIAIKEQDEGNKLTQYLVFDQWHYLGSVDTEAELANLKISKKHLIDTFDDYKILVAFLKSKRDQLNILELSDT
ncbi:excinuclease ABC subunit [Legionella busanensis]|uniref:Excinuclease cho n=1 Tax=Legionella busanensis TaxID=190655 RepID=A0A378JGJ2_9GAMM|nr:3'-5' exonuclease family protein [Legionella busanensis]STX50285.1 excinuclease ABC subunit [Legionella busanensis]